MAEHLILLPGIFSVCWYDHRQSWTILRLYLITQTTYNHNDDVLTVDGPLSGTADTAYLRYDDLRRQVGVIGPDPDGGGALKRRAVRTTFNTRGMPSASERGTVTGVTDSHWNAFVLLLKHTMAYDSHGRLTKTT